MKKHNIILTFCIVLFIFICVSQKLFFSVRNDATLNVVEGDNAKIVGRKLKNDKSIINQKSFYAYFKMMAFMSSCDKIHTGEYNISKGVSFFEVCNKLCRGISNNKTITIPEGLMTFQVIDLINANKNLSGDNIKYAVEGNLLPETYTFKSGTKKKQLLSTMIEDFEKFFEKEWKNRDTKTCILANDYDAIILASIVEAEAKTDAEKPIIASVYLNRLRKNMKLQADPTSIYEITQGKYKLNRQLTLKDLKIKGNYNTYEKYGLPVAPICNAGKKSIQAVMHSATTEYLYFVAKENLSGHYFAKTYEEHLQNIKLVRQKKSK